jgi:uncharacterized damage-inducible protein DinB
MLIEHTISNLLSLQALLNNLSDEGYTAKQKVFSVSSLGQHVRHILEFYVCLLEADKTVCYDDRRRDQRIESDRLFAASVIHDLIEKVKERTEDYCLTLKSNFSFDGTNEVLLQTSLFRELAYCLEHSIHHQAIIKIGVMALNEDVLPNDDFGIAPSTIRFQRQSVG